MPDSNAIATQLDINGGSIERLAHLIRGRDCEPKSTWFKVVSPVTAGEHCAQDKVCPVWQEEAPEVGGIGTGGHEESCIIARVLGPLVRSNIICAACDGTDMLKEGA